jgi:hypothetical protein
VAGGSAVSTYKIVRFFHGKAGADGHLQSRKRTIETGLSLEQAQEHCNDPDTSSTTCTSAAGRARTRKHGDWFDGYYEE